jgi:rSAM/selenodomain-associated transferase 1
MEKSALIIFVRNPVLGKVKTRLAETIGNEKALLIYTELLKHTHSITKNLECDKFVFYADHINEKDIWENEIYRKNVQQAESLGKRMQHSFSELFDIGYNKVLIIGSDCYELTENAIIQALAVLKSIEVVIGPASDGGYYLLGLQTLLPEIFQNILWSTSNVLKDTISVLKSLNCAYQLLPVLNDIDDEADLTDELKIIAGMRVN